MSKNELQGHLYLLGTLLLVFILPLALIVLSYLEVISGIASYIAALGVIGTVGYILIGWFITVKADKEDAIKEQARG